MANNHLGLPLILDVSFLPSHVSWLIFGHARLRKVTFGSYEVFLVEFRTEFYTSLLISISSTNSAPDSPLPIIKFRQLNWILVVSKMVWLVQRILKPCCLLVFVRVFYSHWFQNGNHTRRTQTLHPSIILHHSLPYTFLLQNQSTSEIWSNNLIILRMFWVSRRVNGANSFL